MQILTLLIAWGLVGPGALHLDDDIYARAHRWRASGSVGAGRIDDTSVVLLQPRLSYETAHFIGVLSVPVWLALDESLDRGFKEQWQDPETYAAMLEHLEWQSKGGDFRVYVGTLAQQSLGYGSLVDDYQGRTDPVMPRTGAVFDGDFDRFKMRLLLNSVAQPTVMGASVSLMPLGWFGIDDGGRFKLVSDFVMDVAAPGLSDDHVVAAGGLGLAGVFYKSESLAAEAFVTGNVLRTSFGVHGGVWVEWLMSGKFSGALTMRGEVVGAGEGYVPGYFDVAYETERWSLLGDGDKPKSEIAYPSSIYGRLRIDGRLSALRFELAAESNFEGMTRTSLLGQYNNEQWSLSAMILKRALRDFEGFWAVDDSTAMTLETSVQLVKGFFAYGRFSRGWRLFDEATRRVEAINVWTAGLGYVAGGSV